MNKTCFTTIALLGFAIFGSTLMADEIVVTDADLASVSYSSKSYGQRVSCHDPSIFMDTVSAGSSKTNPAYYIYGSHRATGKTYASSSYQSWSTFSFSNNYTTHVVKTVKDYQGNEVSFGNFNAHSWQYSTDQIGGNEWAPDVVYNPTMGKWLMYMSVNGDHWASSIVCLTANAPTGPWTYQGPVVFSGFQGYYDHVGFTKTDDWKHTDFAIATGATALPARYKVNDRWGSYWPNCIDPCVFYDDEGELWMSYGSWSGGIFMLKLDKTNGLRDYTYHFPYEINGQTATPGSASSNCTSDPYFGKKIAGGYYVSGEASYIEKIGNYYFLFMSYGGLESTGGYQMRIFRSESPTGPYKDPYGTSAIYSKYELNYSKNAATGRGMLLMGGYQWPFMPQAELAQGHNSAIVDHKGRGLVVYHTRFNNSGEGHQVRVHQLFLNDEGWLMAAPYEFSGESITDEQIATTASIADSDIPGTYQIIRHKYNQDTQNKAFQKPVNITLQADGSVTGAMSGTWSRTEGTDYITLKLSNVIYRGVLVNQTIDYTNIKALCIAACSSSSGSITLGENSFTRQQELWGTKVDPKIAIKHTLKNTVVNFNDGATVNSDLSLPATGYLGATVKWTTSDPSLMSATGRINTAGRTGVVTLTMTISMDDYVYTREYHLSVDASAVPSVPVYYPECGSTNCSAAWWTAFSDTYAVGKGESAEFKFVNHNQGNGNNWENWLLVCTNGNDSHGGGGTEYFVLRADAYGWGDSNYSGSNITHNYNWNTFVSDLNGAEVDVEVEYADGHVNVTAHTTTKAGTSYEMTYSQSGISSQKVGIFFTVEKAYIATDGLAIEEIAAEPSSASQAIYDLQGRRQDALRPGLNIVGGRKVLIRQ